MQEAIQPVDFDENAQREIMNEALDAAAVVSDDEDNDNIEDVTPQPRKTGSSSKESKGSKASKEPIIIEEDPTNNEVYGTTPAGELLRYHYRLGHMSFAKLQEMAKRGDIPKRLAKDKPPMCAACVFGTVVPSCMADESKESQNINAHQARSSHTCQSDGVIYHWIHCPAQRESNQEKIQIGFSLHRWSYRLFICAHARNLIISRYTQG